MLNNSNQQIIESIKQLSTNADEKSNSEVLFVYRQNFFRDKIVSVFKQKNIELSLINDFMNILRSNISSLSDLEGIEELLEFCLIDEIFYENLIYEKNNLDKCFNPNISKKTTIYIKKILPDMIRWSGKKGSKVDVGDAERCMQIMTKNISENFGKIEIKGMSSRLKGTGEGYSNTTSVKNNFLKNISIYLPNLDISKIDINNFNLSNKGINFILNLFRQNQISDVILVEFLSNTLTLIYDKLDYKDTLDILNKSLINGKFQVSECLNRMCQIQFKYYKQLKNFNGILFFNSKNLNIKYIIDEHEFYKNLNLFNIDHSFSWKQERNNTFQFTLK